MVRKVTDADLVFPASVRDWLPPYDSVPAEFKRRDNPFVQFVKEWFFRGIDLKEWALERLPGISDDEAQERWKQVQCCLGSWEPKHEHKEAGCAYMLSRFLKEPRRIEGETGVR